MKKNNIIAIMVFLVVLFVFTIGYSIYNNRNSNNTKEEYYCTDYETNTTYTFNTLEEMHEVCDQFSGLEKDKKLESYSIYDDLINNNDDSFTFYPYINTDDKLSIIIVITDCYNPEMAKERAIEWFENHSYDINDYIIEYEYPCES